MCCNLSGCFSCRSGSDLASPYSSGLRFARLWLASIRANVWKAPKNRRVSWSEQPLFWWYRTLCWRLYGLWSPGTSGWTDGGEASLATQAYPLLTAHSKRIRERPPIRKLLDEGKRPERFTGNPKEPQVRETLQSLNWKKLLSTLPQWKLTSEEQERFEHFRGMDAHATTSTDFSRCNPDQIRHGVKTPSGCREKTPVQTADW